MRSTPSDTGRPSSCGADIDALCERIARQILARKLEAPAMFFLEAHLPFVAFAHTLGLLLEPMALPLFGAERIAELRLFLSDRAHVEQLIQRLEQGRRGGGGQSDAPPAEVVNW